jgi:DNA-binding XRE family transcriptional regulator
MNHDEKVLEAMAPRSDASAGAGSSATDSGGSGSDMQARGTDGGGSSGSEDQSSEHSAQQTDRTPQAQQQRGESGKRNRKQGPKPNNVRRLRIDRMMSKAELARRANLSVLTIDRVEKGYGCRMDTKRKILEALGLSLADRVRVFGEEE